MNIEEPEPSLRIAPIADHALYIDFGEVIDAAVNQRVTALAKRVGEARIDGVTGLIPTYRALTVAYDCTRIRQGRLIGHIERLLAEPDAAADPVRSWEVPVAYGGEHGVDLQWLSEHHQLDPDTVIRLHSAVGYRVYMIGFMPGFAYLGGLDARLHTSRRESPRLKTPAGSVSIGGMQTAVASVEAPSGWHLIGRTPARSFEPSREQPFLFSAGDEIRFTPISTEEFDALWAQPDYVPQWTWRT
ncbi:5-oxoprolinase subunit PxpB [Pseudomonas syringae]|uniref:5-oxoprolinase subunit PxpB n=1 Tax=Pseudomonas syringae TaxID=317 RepID=UPI000AD12B6E|nr:5-oxoprolinase subunit PxpB [Pseudomonas syringae]